MKYHELNLKIWIFAVIFQNFWGNLRFMNTRNAILMTNLCVSITSYYVITIWYSHPHVLISELIHSKSALDKGCSALKIPCFRAKKISAEQRWFSLEQRWILQFWTALIQRKSELISADVFHILWISTEKRQNSETALLSADYLWDFNSGVQRSQCFWRVVGSQNSVNGLPSIKSF